MRSTGTSSWGAPHSASMKSARRVFGDIGNPWSFSMMRHAYRVAGAGRKGGCETDARGPHQRPHAWEVDQNPTWGVAVSDEAARPALHTFPGWVRRRRASPP